MEGRFRFYKAMELVGVGVDICPERKETGKKSSKHMNEWNEERGMIITISDSLAVWQFGSLGG